MRLAGGWAALAALTAIVPALVYAYALLAAVKELTALSMLLTLGCLVVLHRRWLGAAPARAMPFALVLAAGVSALGLAFGAWALAAVAVLAVVLVGDVCAGRTRPRDVLPLIGVAALALAIAALPTWADVSEALHVASEIASTSNSGNLRTPLHAIQALGVWLNGSYKLAPAGAALVATHVLIALMLASALLAAPRRSLWRGAQPCWRSRSSAACSRRTRCCTTAPTSRRRRATTSWRRSTRASRAGGRRC